MQLSRDLFLARLEIKDVHHIHYDCGKQLALDLCLVLFAVKSRSTTVFFCYVAVIFHRISVFFYKQSLSTIHTIFLVFFYPFLYSSQLLCHYFLSKEYVISFEKNIFCVTVSSNFPFLCYKLTKNPKILLLQIWQCVAVSKSVRSFFL